MLTFERVAAAIAPRISSRIAVGRTVVERIGDVVINPFADEENRFATAADPAQPFCNRPERPSGRSRVEAAFAVEGVANGCTACARASKKLFVARHRSGFQLQAHEPVDGRQQQPLTAGEILRRVVTPGRVHNRHQVVRRQMPLDEPAGCGLDAALH